MTEIEIPALPSDVSNPPPSWVSADDPAQKEVSKWDNQKVLLDQKTNNDLNFLKVYGWVLVVLTIVFAFLFIASLVSWACHYVMPEGWGWLKDNQLSKIQSIIFSGTLGAIVSTVVGRQISKT